jgi:hypothetical protein
LNAATEDLAEDRGEKNRNQINLNNRENMKNLLSTALAAISFAPSFAAIRTMAPNDPNLDAGWVWWNPEPVEVYSSLDDGAVSRHRPRLPYFTPGNVLSGAAEPDARPEDGWMLVHRDFGVPAEGQPFPFFTLYNRYRGIFRVMLYNAANREGSYFLGELGFLEGGRWPEAGAALFTFADDSPNHAYSYLESHNPASVLACCSPMTAYGAWAVFDFPLVGYDPQLAGKDPILAFRVASIDKRSLDLKGQGELQLFQRIEAGEARPELAAPGWGLVAAAQNGAATYKSVSAFVQSELLSEAGEQKHQGALWYRAARAVARSPLGSYLPLAGAMGAVVESFIGGPTRAADWEPLKFTGQLPFRAEGSQMSRHDLWCHAFYLKPGPAGDVRAQRPLRAVDWGIFNFAAPAALRAAARGAGETVRLARAPEIRTNPDSGMDLASVRVAFITGDGKPGGAAAAPEGSGSSGFLDLKAAMEAGTPCSGKPGAASVVALLWELRFRIRKPTLQADPELVILKRTGFDWLAD